VPVLTGFGQFLVNEEEAKGFTKGLVEMLVDGSLEEDDCVDYLSQEIRNMQVDIAAAVGKALRAAIVDLLTHGLQGYVPALQRIVPTAATSLDGDSEDIPF
jgi:hypothetical protein